MIDDDARDVEAREVQSVEGTHLLEGSRDARRAGAPGRRVWPGVARALVRAAGRVEAVEREPLVVVDLTEGCSVFS